jgi:hypothetical protein
LARWLKKPRPASADLPRPVGAWVSGPDLRTPRIVKGRAVALPFIF